MSAGVFRSVIALAPIAFLAPACVVLDLFPSGEQGGGGVGAGAATGGGATNVASTGTDSVTSTGAGGGEQAISVEWVKGLGSPASLTSVRFLDVDADSNTVAVVGVANGQTNATVGFDSCGGSLPFDGAFFVARFAPDSGDCMDVVFLDASLEEPLTAAIVLQGGEPRVAVSGLFNAAYASAIYGVQTNGSPFIVLDQQAGVSIVDLAVDGPTLLAGGGVRVAAPACGDVPSVGAGDEDAFFAQISMNSCAFPQIGHDDSTVGRERVTSIAASSGRRGFVTASEHTINVYGQDFGGDSSVAIFQDEMGDAFALGDFTCPDELSPPRAAFSVNGDWVFGPVCGRLELAYRPPAGTFEKLLDVEPKPTFFDRPSIVVAGDRLLIGGQYSSLEGMPLWPSPLLTGVVGLVRADGTPLVTLDLSGQPPTAGSTEVTGVAASSDGNTAWVIGNHATTGATFGTAQHRGAGIPCTSTSTPCMPLLAKLSLSPR